MVTRRTSLSSGSVGVNQCGPICSQGVIGVEVGQEPLSKLQTYSIESDFISPIGADVEVEILSIRSGELLNGQNNRAVITPINISFATEGSRLTRFRIYRDGTFNIPTWTYENPVYNPLQKLTGGNAIIGSGYKGVGFFIGNNRADQVTLHGYNLSIYNGQTLTITGTSIQNSADLSCMINYNLVD
jgi:hypothetical protein